MNTTDIPNDLISRDAAAKILGTCPQTILRWILNGRIIGYRIGSRWRVSKKDVYACVQVHTVQTANDRKIAEEAARPMTKKELSDRERETDEYLRRVGIRR